MALAETPGIADVAVVLRQGADFLSRKVEIARAIAALQAEDAQINDLIRATWGPRVDEMHGLLKAFLAQVPPAVVVPPPVESVPKNAPIDADVNPDEPEPDSVKLDPEGE